MTQSLKSSLFFLLSLCASMLRVSDGQGCYQVEVIEHYVETSPVSLCRQGENCYFFGKTYSVLINNETDLTYSQSPNGGKINIKYAQKSNVFYVSPGVTESGSYSFTKTIDNMYKFCLPSGCCLCDGSYFACQVNTKTVGGLIGNQEFVGYGAMLKTYNKINVDFQKDVPDGEFCLRLNSDRSDVVFNVTGNGAFKRTTIKIFPTDCLFDTTKSAENDISELEVL